MCELRRLRLNRRRYLNDRYYKLPRCSEINVCSVSKMFYHLSSDSAQILLGGDSGGENPLVNEEGEKRKRTSTFAPLHLCTFRSSLFPTFMFPKGLSTPNNGPRSALDWLEWLSWLLSDFNDHFFLREYTLRESRDPLPNYALSVQGLD